VEQIPWLYDGVMGVMERFGLGRWRRWVAGGAQGRTLEIGCGTGRNFRHYPPGVRPIGVDPDPRVLQTARGRDPGVPVVRAVAESLPFPDDAFDTVVSTFVFCSVGDPARGLAELRRVLVPGGRLRMIEHVRDSRRVPAWIQDRIQPAWTAISGGCRPNRETVDEVLGSGFRLVDGVPETDARRGTLRRLVAASGKA
jgi:SAM-dependent methyltransferase